MKTLNESILCAKMSHNSTTLARTFLVKALERVSRHQSSAVLLYLNCTLSAAEPAERKMPLKPRDAAALEQEQRRNAHKARDVYRVFYSLWHYISIAKPTHDVPLFTENRLPFGYVHPSYRHLRGYIKQPKILMNSRARAPAASASLTYCVCV